MEKEIIVKIKISTEDNKHCNATCEYIKFVKMVSKHNSNILYIKNHKYCRLFDTLIKREKTPRYQRCDERIQAEQQQTTDAVGILHKRYVDNDPKRQKELEQTRKEDEKERKIKLCLAIISGRYSRKDLIDEDYELIEMTDDNDLDEISMKAEEILYNELLKN